MQSLVKYYQLTKDPQNRISYDQMLLRRAAVVAGKLEGAELTASDIIAVYDNNSNYIFPSGDAGNANLQPVENQFYSDLTSTLAQKQADYIDAKYSQQDILDAIDKMKGGMLTGDRYNEVSKQITSGTSKVIGQMEALKTKAKEMAEEYYDTNIGNKIGVGSFSYHFAFSFNPVLLYLILLVIFILGRLITVHIYNSEYRVHLMQWNDFVRGTVQEK